MSTECIDHGRTSSLRLEGYAMVGIPGVRSRCTNLHRLVYCEHNKCSLESIKGKVVRHTCDNPRCINPEHLLIGSRGDNNRDRAERGRSAKAVPSRRKLNQAQADTIRTRYNPKRVGNKAPDGVTQLAKDYGVDINTILNIIKERTHVQDSACRP